jgi:subtilisin family serine protease
VPASAAAYTCPSSDTVASSGPRGGTAGTTEERRMLPRRGGKVVAAAATLQRIAVSYDARLLAAERPTLTAHEVALGASLVHEYSFAHTGLITRVLTVPAAQATRVASALRGVSGVRSVGPTGSRRYTTSVNAPAFTNDPYFDGFSAAQVAVVSSTPTFEIEPLVENASVPGQWDMHVTRLEYAFGYSLPNNGSNVTNASVLGSAAVKIAVIDTGEDSTHPELAPKIKYQRCFITSSTTNVQSSSFFSTDEDGHGTDVAGIAGETTNNQLGFTAAGGNVSLYAYRVFPTPDDSCTSDTSTDPQCGSDTADIASAIDDAVTHHVNVISMSLGGGQCSANGQDEDALEGAAVKEAIAAKIIVVAAAGNSGGPPVEAPGCDPGVIAVGATSLADGSPNGSSKAGGSPSAPFEYVATYTDYGTPGAAVNSPSAWGIVAPGGDPLASGNDVDDLHWIENIWTSTPYMKNASDMSFTGNCSPDFASTNNTPDCRVLIAGTSMATPHVAGAAALILSVAPSYQDPTLMRQLLCSTAADIGDPNEGCGRLDVYRAIATALGDANIPASSPVP